MKIQRLRRSRRSSHVDDWLMTYADMITLLLCFFVLFLAIALNKKEPPPPPPQAPIVAEIKPQQLVPPEPAPPEPAVPQPEPQPVVEPQPEEGAKVEEPSEPKPQEEPQPQIAEAPKEKEKGPEPFEQKGDRITSVEMNSSAFFDSGSAILSDAGKKILDDIAEKLKAPTFEGYQITVEGHTDDAPIKTPLYPSNWELSTARAASVVRYFLERGLPAAKLRAAGYGDTFPKVPNRDAAGNPLPANQAQNRRVVIRLDKIEKNQNAP